MNSLTLTLSYYLINSSWVRLPPSARAQLTRLRQTARVEHNSAPSLLPKRQGAVGSNTLSSDAAVRGVTLSLPRE